MRQSSLNQIKKKKQGERRDRRDRGTNTTRRFIVLTDFFPSQLFRTFQASTKRVSIYHPLVQLEGPKNNTLIENDQNLADYDLE